MLRTLPAAFLLSFAIVCSAAADSAAATQPYILKATAEEIREGDGPAVFTVTRRDVAQGVTLRWSFVQTDDYYANRREGTLVFEPGQTTRSLSVPIPDDDLFGSDRYEYKLTLVDENGLNYRALVVVADDDPPVYYGFARERMVAIESDGDIYVPVERSGDTTKVSRAYVEFRTRSGRAERGVWLAFPAAATTATVVFPWTNDDAWGGHAEYVVSCRGEGQRPWQATVAELIIAEDEPEPAIVSSVVEVMETDSTRDARVAVTLTVPFRYGRSYQLQTADGTAGRDDYRLDQRFVSFSGGEQATAVTVTILADDEAELDEMFTLFVGGVSVKIRIVDDDRPPFDFAFDEPSYLMDEAAATIGIRRSGDSSSAVTTQLHFLPRTPLTWPEPMTIEFAAGETFKRVTLPTADEFFTGERNAVIALEYLGFQGARAELTLFDDEPMPQLSISGPSAVAEGGPGESRATEFEISLSSPVGASIAVALEIVPGTATAADYVAITAPAHLAPGVTSQRVAVSIRGDADVEPHETFTVRIKSCCQGFATVGQDTATATILNDDAGQAFALQAPAAIDERAGWLEATVSRVATEEAGAASVTLSADAARTFPPVAVRFRRGEARKVVRFYVNDDVWSGDAELVLALSAGATTDLQRRITIREDEAKPVVSIRDTFHMLTPPKDGYWLVDLVAEFAIDIQPASATAIQLRLWKSQDEPAIPVTIPARTTRLLVAVPMASIRVTRSSFEVKIEPLVLNSVEIGRATAVCRFHSTSGVEALVAPYDARLAAGTRRTITIVLNSNAILTGHLELVSSHPGVVDVPATVPLTLGSRLVTFEATALAPGSANISIKLPGFFSSGVLQAPLQVHGAHTPVADERRLTLAPAESIRVQIGAAPVALETIHATVRALDPSVLTVATQLRIPAGATAALDVYGAAAGQTEVVITFPAENGGTELRIPVTVSERPGRRRSAGR